MERTQKDSATSVSTSDLSKSGTDVGTRQRANVAAGNSVVSRLLSLPDVVSSHFRNQDLVDTDIVAGTAHARLEHVPRSEVPGITETLTLAERRLTVALGKMDDPRSADVATATQKFFHRADAKTVAVLRSKLGKLLAAFRAGITVRRDIEPEEPGSPTAGRVSAIPLFVWHFAFGPIHLARNDNPLELAKILIHEASHRYLDTSDEAYLAVSCFNAKREMDCDYNDRGLDAGHALINADSIAYFCMTLGEGA